MRTAYIGNFAARYSTENEVRIALESLGHEVVPVQENELTDRDGWAEVADMPCDFVLWTHTHPYGPEAAHGAQRLMLERAERVGRPVVAYHLDRWWGLVREQQLRDEPFFRCSLVCTADGGHEAEFAALGVRHAWYPPAISHVWAESALTSTRRDMHITQKKVAFVGSWQSYHEEWPERYALVMHLRKQYNHKLALYPKGGVGVRGEALTAIYQTVPVIVGDSCLSGGATHYISDRVPETVGRRGFLLHPRVEGVTDGTLYTEGEHLACYEAGNHRSLDEAVSYWLTNAQRRQEIARSGQAHVIAEHTYRVRMERLLREVADGRADW